MCRRTYHQWYPLLMSNLRNFLKVWHIISWIPNRLHVDGLGLIVDLRRQLLGILARDEPGGDTKTGQEDFELVIGTSVEIGGGDDVVTCLCKGSNDHELGRLAR